MNRTTGILDYFRAYHRVARLEYAPGEVPAMLFPLLLGASALGDIFLPRVMEALLAFVLLYLSGFIINSWVDRDLDRKYASFKGGISEGVDVFGERGMKLLLAIHIGIPMVLAVHLSVSLMDPWFLIMIVGGAFLGLGYSQPPFHFKVRGWLHAVSLGISAYFIPFLFIYYAVALTFHPLAVLFILCFTIAHYSMEMANQAADAKEDLEEGLLTPAARWGLSRTLGWSRYGTAAGTALAVLLLYIFFVDGLPMMEGSGAASALDPLAAVGVFVLLSAIMVVAYGIPVKGEDDLYRISNLPVSMGRRSRMIKDRINFSGWQASGVTGGVTCLGILFIMGLVLAPAVHEGVVESDEGDVAAMELTGVSYPWTYSRNGALYTDAVVTVEGPDGSDPAGFTIQGRSMSAGRIIDTVNATPEEDWSVSMSLRIHDNQDTSFEYRLFGPEGAVGEPLLTSSYDDLYIAEAFLQPADDILGHDSIRVRIWNDGPDRSPGTVSVTLIIHGIHNTLSEDRVEVNEDVVTSVGEWWAVFPLDILDPVEDFDVKLAYNGGDVDDLEEVKAS